MDIGTEELSHLEVIGALARMHLKPSKTGRKAAVADPLVAITGGGGVNLYNSVGSAWTADYFKVTGQPEVDVRNNIAAEARAKITYERLMAFTNENDTNAALPFLMTREITHMKSLMLALDGLNKGPLEIGELPPTEGVVNQFFNESTGKGQNGEVDVTTNWAKKHGFEVVENPASPLDRIDADSPKPSQGKSAA